MDRERACREAKALGWDVFVREEASGAAGVSFRLPGAGPFDVEPSAHARFDPQGRLNMIELDGERITGLLRDEREQTLYEHLVAARPRTGLSTSS